MTVHRAAWGLSFFLLPVLFLGLPVLSAIRAVFFSPMFSAPLSLTCPRQVFSYEVDHARIA